jgi:predicted polyphosphate/ATP-dependent NAD kinase
VRTVLGENAGDALDRARAAVADGADALIAVGGDGMAHLALQAVAGTRTPLVLVAAGGTHVERPEVTVHRAAEAEIAAEEASGTRTGNDSDGCR